MRVTEGIKVLKVDSFNGGLNTFFEPNRIDNKELAVARNVVLTDKGAPTPRPGIKTFADINGNNPVYLLTNYVNTKTGVQEIVFIDHNGVLKKYYNNAVSTIGTHTFTPGHYAMAAMSRNNNGDECLFITNGVDPLTVYNGTTTIRYTALTTPTGLTASVGSGIAGSGFSYSYRVTAVGPVGETIASSPVGVTVGVNRDNWNFDPANPDINRSVLLSWNPVSGAVAYNVYGVKAGYETFLARVEGGTSWRDYGLKSPSVFYFAPTANTTQAPKSKIITTFKTSIVMVDVDNPSRLWYSAGVDKPESFAIGDGGGYIDINAGAGDGPITALRVFRDQLVVFKKNSVWTFNFTENIPVVRLIAQDRGCVGRFATAMVDNDLFFIGKRNDGLALYSLGYEPNFLNELRTKEISTKVRELLVDVPAAHRDLITVAYLNPNFYIVTPEPDGVCSKAVLYDRERVAYFYFEAKDKVNNSFRDIQVVTYNNEQFVLFRNAGKLLTFDSTLSTDLGGLMGWEYETKHFDMEAPFDYKRFYWVALDFIKAKGYIRIRIILDDKNFDFELDVANKLLKSQFGVVSFGSGEFVEVEDLDNKTYVSNVKIPINRLGLDSIARTIAINITGVDTNSVASLQAVEVAYRKLKNYRRYQENIYHI